MPGPTPTPAGHYTLAALVLGLASAAGCGRTPPFPGADGDGGLDDTADPPAEGWLLTLDTNGYTLLRIDPRDGATTKVCDLEADGSRYTSSGFAPDGRLFVTYKVDDSDIAEDQLARLDPCTCTRTPMGTYGFGGAAGLAWSEDAMYAISHSVDTLLSIDPGSGTATTIGPLGVDIRNHGASWSDEEEALVVLEGSQDLLYAIDVATGRARVLADPAFDFSTVGFEIQPGTGRWYACTGDAVLYEIDPRSGVVDEVGPLDHPGNCGNLAAPRGPVDCVDP